MSRQSKKETSRVLIEDATRMVNRIFEADSQWLTRMAEEEVLWRERFRAKKELAKALPHLLKLMNNPVFVKKVNDDGLIFDVKEILKALSSLKPLERGHDGERPENSNE